ATALDGPQTIAQPLHCRAGDKDAAFQRVDGLIVRAPADSCQQTILRWHTLRAGVHEHKTAGTIGVLGHSNLKTRLPKGRGLLIACVARDLDRRTEKLSIGFAKDTTGWHNRRQHGARNTQFAQNHIVPVALVDVVEQRARSIGRIGSMNASSGQTPDQERIHIPKEYIAALSFLAYARHIVENPFHLRARKVRVGHQTSALAEFFVKAPGLQSIANRHRQTTLPDNRVEDWFAGVSVPDHRRFALVGNANGRNIGGTGSGSLERFLRDRELTGPDGLWIVFDQARRGINLRELLLRNT